MSMQTIKFYQTGTFTVGNRLLSPQDRTVQANMQRTNSLNSGHRACQGCGEALGARYAIDAAGLISAATIVPPTSQNQARIEADLRAFLPAVLPLDDAAATLRCEQLIRSYDPCISCATHFLRLSIDRVVTPR